MGIGRACPPRSGRARAAYLVARAFQYFDMLSRLFFKYLLNYNTIPSKVKINGITRRSSQIYKQPLHGGSTPILTCHLEIS